MREGTGRPGEAKEVEGELRRIGGRKEGELTLLGLSRHDEGKSELVDHEANIHLGGVESGVGFLRRWRKKGGVETKGEVELEIVRFSPANKEEDVPRECGFPFDSRRA